MVAFLKPTYLKEMSQIQPYFEQRDEHYVTVYIIFQFYFPEFQPLLAILYLNVS